MTASYFDKKKKKRHLSYQLYSWPKIKPGVDHVSEDQSFVTQTQLICLYAMSGCDVLPATFISSVSGSILWYLQH